MNANAKAKLQLTVKYWTTLSEGDEKVNRECADIFALDPQLASHVAKLHAARRELVDYCRTRVESKTPAK